jgi:osmotically-inducible protein OsmY/outer membrane protein OmpA-like peptidoglycan-associated protein
VPPRGEHRSSSSLTIALATTVALVAATACNASQETLGAELLPTAAAVPLPPVSPAGTASTPVGVTTEDLTYDPAVPTLIGVDVEPRLAIRCGLPRNQVYFKYNSAKLLPGAKALLEKIATCAKTGPVKGQGLLVVGRTDPTGSAQDNRKLGLSRAESVARYLGELGVDQARVEVVSMGEAGTDKAFPFNWPHDRRVTIRLQPSVGPAAPPARKEMTDHQITAAVVHLLRSDSALLDQAIDAKVHQGIATLSGTADHLLASERAVKLAQTLRGVRGVVNTIVLRIPWRSDEHLRQDVVLALLFDAATDACELVPAVKDGVVTLRGTTQSNLETRLAVHVAKGVKGVREVKDEITQKITSNRPDREIAAEVRRVLAISVWLDGSLISTEVKDGVVTLSGVVGSAAHQDLASRLAWTAGVKSVSPGGLTIEPWAMPSGQRRKPLVTPGDPRLAQAVRDALVYDPRVVPFSPGVAVTGGVVTLTGVVDNLKAKRAAEQDARNTVGVRQVKNLLKVSPAQPVGDDALAGKVTSALLRDPFVGGHALSAKAKDGVVTLTGSVDSPYQATHAVDLASRARGVVDVRSHLTVSLPILFHYDVGYDPAWSYFSPGQSFWSAYPRDPSWPRISDAALKSNVEGELFWSPFVDLFQVTVKADRGVVTLTGTVDSWSEHRAATDKAYAGGASAVKNELKVR